MKSDTTTHTYEVTLPRGAAHTLTLPDGRRVNVVNVGLKSGGVLLGVAAPPSVPVYRSELLREREEGTT